MTDHEKTAIRIGKWTPGMKCSVNKVECRHFDQPWFKSASDEDWGKNWADHDIPCPPITSDDIFAWLLRNDSYDIRIYSYEDTVLVEIKDEDYEDCDCVINGEGPTLLAALENAVAQLPEEKE